MNTDQRRPPEFEINHGIVFSLKIIKRNRNRLIDSGNKLRVARWERGLETWVKKVKGSRRTNGDVKHSTGKVVDNIVIAAYDVRWGVRLTKAITKQLIEMSNHCVVHLKLM